MLTRMKSDIAAHADSAGYLSLQLGDENFLALVDGEDAVRPRAAARQLPAAINTKTKTQERWLRKIEKSWI